LYYSPFHELLMGSASSASTWLRYLLSVLGQAERRGRPIVDQLVYELYGLRSEEISIMEGR